MKSDHAHRNANSDTVTTELRLTGSTIDRKVRHDARAVDLAPPTISSSGMPVMNAVKISTPNGTASVESARISPGIVFSMPQLLKIR